MNRKSEMNARKNMILIKGSIKTSEVRSCQWNAEAQRVNVEFNNGKIYTYVSSNVEWLSFFTSSIPFSIE